MDLLDLVSPLQGTESNQDFSRGNTLPLVCTPWPMTAWTMQTDAGRWAFRWTDAKLQGIRATHQPSPWMGDHGHFAIMPQVGERLLDAEERAASYSKADLIVRPDYLRVRLLRYACTIEVVPTPRCAKMRFHFADARKARLILDCFDENGLLGISDLSGLVHGGTSANYGGVPENFRLSFCLRFNVPIRAIHTAESNRNGLTERVPPFCGAIEFDVPKGRMIECDIATSYLGEAQARTNLLREIGDASFEHLRAQARLAWNKELSRIEVSNESDQQRRTFYSCFYRTLTFPQMMHEEDAAGEVVHYSPYSGARRPGVLYTGHGFWDSYRTTYPFYALLFPEKYSEFLQGWINAYRESGWYPRWPSPGHRVCMLSTQVDVVFADALVKGIGGFNWEEAYEGLRKNAFEEPAIDEGFGRPGLRDYIRYGYLPADQYLQSVAATLDNAHCDFCLSQIARSLGRSEDARQLLHRSAFYSNVFDPQTGFMRGRKADGSWLEPFNEFEWGGPYVEGGPWQTSWGVPHDPAGLIALHGGKAPFLKKLNQMLSLPPSFTAGNYVREIHEMTEMAVAGYGQYAHSNQPVHAALYLFDEAGAPELTDYWVRRILREYYNPGPGGFPGDEDNGQMSAWYILSALGLFPFCPGKPDYKIVAPLFQEATIHLSDRHSLAVIPGAELVTRVEDSVVLNGRKLSRRDISHQQISEGGLLEVHPFEANHAKKDREEAVALI